MLQKKSLDIMYYTNQIRKLKKQIKQPGINLNFLVRKYISYQYDVSI